jgi:hypothetical protein
MDTPIKEEEHHPTASRPLGYWLRVVDGLLTRQFADAFAGDHLDRRDWMLLNVLDGSIEAPFVAARLARGGKRVRALADRGWIVCSDDGWALTDEGRAAKDRLSADVDGIRDRVSAAVSPEDLATTMASLEAIARELGWDETAARGERSWSRGHRRHGGHGFGPHGGRGFGRHGGHGFGPGFGRHGGHGFGRHGGHGFGPRAGHGFGPHGEQHRSDEHAYERGFDAGFSRGREAAASTPAA